MMQVEQAEPEENMYLKTLSSYTKELQGAYQVEEQGGK